MKLWKKNSIEAEIIKSRADFHEIENRKSREKINKTERWFFEKIKKTDKPLTRLIKKKRRNKSLIRNERGTITTDPMDIERKIKEQYEQLYSYKHDNHNEMDQFLQRYDKPKFTQKETILIGWYLLNKLNQQFISC